MISGDNKNNGFSCDEFISGILLKRMIMTHDQMENGATRVMR